MENKRNKDLKSIYNILNLLLIPITLCLCVYGCTSGLLKYIFPFSWLRFGLILGCLLVMVGLFLVTKKYAEDRILYIYLLIMGIFPLLTVMKKSSWTFTTLIFYLTMLVFCAVSINMTLKLKLVLKIFVAVDFIYAFSTIILYFTPTLYTKYVAKLFDAPYKITRMYKAGQISGLANHYSANASLIFTGFIIVFAYFLINFGKNKKTIINSFVMMIFAAGLLLTGKRAHLLFGMAAMFGILLFYMKSKGVSAKRIFRIIGIIAGAGILIGGICYLWIPALSVTINRVFSIFTGDGDTSRSILWRMAMIKYFENPILGMGWQMYRGYASPLTGFGSTYDVHNVYLQLFCEIGIIGTVVYLGWFIRTMVGTVKSTKVVLYNAYFNSEDKICLMFALGYQIFFYLYCFTGNPLYDEICFFPYFISCAIILRYGSIIRKNRFS